MRTNVFTLIPGPSPFNARASLGRREQGRRSLLCIEVCLNRGLPMVCSKFMPNVENVGSCSPLPPSAARESGRGVGGEGRGQSKASVWVLWILLGALAWPLRAGAQEAGFSWAPRTASTVAPRIDALFYTDVGLSAFIAGSICLLIIYFCWKYRRGAKADRSNAPSKSVPLETAWIGIPVCLALGVYFWGTRIYFDMFKVPPGAMQVYVIGKQWMWKIEHPNGRREIDELHVPVGRPIQLVLSSQDVIHSFFVPAFRIKQDVLPLRQTTIWFQATKPGRYHLFCAQYCGMNHSRMTGWVYAMPQTDFQRWQSEGDNGPTLAQAGALLYRQLGCSGCHGESNTVRAPSLVGIYGKPVPLQGRQMVVADDRYLHDSILLPNLQVAAGYKPVMPSYKGQVSEEQVLELIAYIKSLGQDYGRAEPRRPAAGGGPPYVQAQKQSVKARQQQNRTTLQGGANQ